MFLLQCQESHSTCDECMLRASFLDVSSIVPSIRHLFRNEAKILRTRRMGGGGERSPPMLTQLVSRRAAEEHGTEGWARHSVAAETRGPGVWFSKSSGQDGWFKPFFLETSRLRYLTSVSGKTKTFRCSFVSYWAGKVLSGGLRPARKSEFTFRLKNHTHKQAGLWRE